MRSFWLLLSFWTVGSKPGSAPKFRIGASAPARKAGIDDFLNSNNGKNDYDWYSRNVLLSNYAFYLLSMSSLHVELKSSTQIRNVISHRLFYYCQSCGLVFRWDAFPRMHRSSFVLQFYITIPVMSKYSLSIWVKLHCIRFESSGRRWALQHMGTGGFAKVRDLCCLRSTNLRI